MNLSKKPSELIPSFLNELDCSEATKSTYKRVLILFSKYLALTKNDFCTISRNQIIQFKDHINKNCSSRTTRLYLAVLHKFYGWLEESGIFQNITKGLKREHVKQGYKRLPLTLEQAKTLLDSIDTETPAGKRNYCLISLLINTGFRRAEIASLNIGDLFTLNGVPGIYVKRKGHHKKDQHKVLANEMYATLIEFAGERINQPDSPLFLTCVPNMEPRRLSPHRIADIVKQHLQKIGLTDSLYSCHSLRHTTALIMYMQGKDIHEIMEYMGHSSLSTTQLYTQLIREMQSWNNSSANIIYNLLKTDHKISADARKH